MIIYDATLDVQKENYDSYNNEEQNNSFTIDYKEESYTIQNDGSIKEYYNGEETIISEKNDTITLTGKISFLYQRISHTMIKEILKRAHLLYNPINYNQGYNIEILTEDFEAKDSIIKTYNDNDTMITFHNSLFKKAPKIYNTIKAKNFPKIEDTNNILYIWEPFKNCTNLEEINNQGDLGENIEILSGIKLSINNINQKNAYYSASKSPTVIIDYQPENIKESFTSMNTDIIQDEYTYMNINLSNTEIIINSFTPTIYNIKTEEDYNNIHEEYIQYHKIKKLKYLSAILPKVIIEDKNIINDSNKYNNGYAYGSGLFKIEYPETLKELKGNINSIFTFTYDNTINNNPGYNISEIQGNNIIEHIDNLKYNNIHLLKDSLPVYSNNIIAIHDWYSKVDIIDNSKTTIVNDNGDNVNIIIPSNFIITRNIGENLYKDSILYNIVEGDTSNLNIMDNKYYNIFYEAKRAYKTFTRDYSTIINNYSNDNETEIDSGYIELNPRIQHYNNGFPYYEYPLTEFDAGGYVYSPDGENLGFKQADKPENYKYKLIHYYSRNNINIKKTNNTLYIVSNDYNNINGYDSLHNNIDKDIEPNFYNYNNGNYNQVYYVIDDYKDKQKIIPLSNNDINTLSEWLDYVENNFTSTYNDNYNYYDSLLSSYQVGNIIDFNKEILIKNVEFNGNGFVIDDGYYNFYIYRPRYIFVNDEYIDDGMEWSWYQKNRFGNFNNIVLDNKPINNLEDSNKYCFAKFILDNPSLFYSKG